MDLTCLSVYPPLPDVPKTANDSNISYIHPTYEPNHGGLAQIISSSIIQSTFSTNDIHSLLNKLFNKDVSSWSVSEITKTQPITSIIIYTSVTLALFLLFSIIFCVISCCNSNKYQERRRRGTSKCTQVCVCLVIIIYLIGIGDTIYVAYRINKSKSSIDDTIKEVNRDIYPKEISEHIIYLTKQFNRLDQYCTKSNSILINASKSMLVKSFDDVLNQKYFLQDIVQTVNNTDKHIQELSDEIDKHSTIPQAAIIKFKDFQKSYQSMIIYIQTPIKEVCKYANASETDIDEILLEGLDIVHKEIKKLNDTIYQDVLNEITPWQDKMLMNIDTEEKIRGYISIAEIVFLVLVIVLGGIPLIFFISIIISRLCCCNNDESSDEKSNGIAMSDVSSVNDYSHNKTPVGHYPHNRVTPANHHQQQIRSRKINSNKSSCCGVVCLMRIAFFIMIILLIILILLTSIFYTLDLALQGTCRTVHNDQPYLINFLSDQLIKSNVIIGNSSEMNMTVTNIIQDCHDQVHFSRKLLKNYWSTIDGDIKDMMNMLSEQIHDQFIESFAKINITWDMDLLNQLAIEANISNISVLVQKIDTDLDRMEGYFQKINSSNATLPDSLVQTTINEFEDYVKKVIESTTDSCPLPLATVYKTDTLVCHTLGNSISGLWLSVFIFMSLIIIGVCIFGICVYKRLN